MTRRNEELNYLMNNRSLARLQNEFDKLCEEKNYLPSSGEGETKATQLATAICKLNYRYRNDGDMYTRRSCSRELGTFANRIHNHCFRLKRYSNYEDNLKYMLIMGMSIIDSLASEDSVGSVYEEEGVWYRK